MTKKDLRNKYRAIRGEILLREEKTCAIEKKLFSNKLFRNCTDVFLYCSSGSEVSTTQIGKTALSLGKKVAYPKCTDSDGNMEFYYVNSADELREGMYGIYEPVPCDKSKATPSAESLVIVPALAFDENGYRLGYGKGYYDRYLALYSCKTLGIAFNECLCGALPHGAHDYKVDCIITDKVEYYFN